MSTKQTGQVDTGFTLVEVVKPSEFARHTPLGGAEAGSLTREQAMAAATADPHEDARYGRLFVVLDAQETLAHYAPRLDELRPFVDAGGAHVRTLLVNGRYLGLLPPEQAALARAVLVVDTKGLEPGAAQEIFEGGARPAPECVARFVDAAALRALFLRTAASALFLVPAAQCRVAGPQISEFELAALMASNRARSVADAAAELKKVFQCAGSKNGYGNGGGGNGNNGNSGKDGGGFWKLVRPMLGAWACAVDVARVATDIIGKVTAGTGGGAGGAGGTGGAGGMEVGGGGAAARAALGGAGNSRWGSTRFVFTKMDEVVWTPAEERAFWYDVGRVLALSCHFIETPPPAHCLRVALPGPQLCRRADAAPVTGDLAQLTRRTVVAAAQNLWEEQLDRTIVAAAARLRALVSAEAYALTRRATLLRVDEIAQRAECRLQDTASARLAAANAAAAAGGVPSHGDS